MNAGTPSRRTAGNNTRIGATSTAFAFLLATSACAAVPSPTPARAPDPAAISGELAALRVAEGRASADVDRSKIEDRYGSLLQRSPNDPKPRAAYAEFLARQGRARDAAREMGRASADAPADAALAHRSGGLFFASGDVRSAASSFERAAQLAPESASYKFDLANLLYLFRRDLAGVVAPNPDEVLLIALKRFNEATEIEPQNPEYWRAYAEAFYIVPGANWGEARRAWLRYHDLTTDKDFARLQLLRIAIRRGNRQEAIHWADALPAGHRLGARLRAQAEALPDS